MSDVHWVRPSPHQAEVRAFLQKKFGIEHWDFSLPHGWGSESYFAHAGEQTYFVKLGAPLTNVQAMASLDLTPPVIAADYLTDGTTLLIQPFVEGRRPSWPDFQQSAQQIASIVGTMHRSREVRSVLPQASTDQYRELGLHALQRLRQRWDKHKAQVPSVAGEVDDQLDSLDQQMQTIGGAGAVVSHNDLCNANWLISASGKIYLIDLDGMTMDDPASDLGAICWWYYPPDLRPHFLHAAGYIHHEQLRIRMRLRMAMHCLDILLPREHSFDRFSADHFADQLADFRAIIAGKENPRGYAE